MVKKISISAGTILAASLQLASASITEPTLITMESKMVQAIACENRQPNDDTKTAENRAIDTACLSAIKQSGIIQKYNSSLDSSTLNLIAYRLIDENMFNLTHTITTENDKKVCVNVQADVEVTSEKLTQMITQNQKTENEANIVEVAEEVNRIASIKPQTLNEKKLLYINHMSFWDGSISNHYKDLLRELFSHSDYFYVTEDQEMADYIVSPQMKNAEVDKIDEKNHRMQMVLELSVNAPNQHKFKPLSETQNHFILFSATKNEQEVADTLIKKLLTRSANNINDKINKSIQKQLEETKIGRK